MTNDLDAPPNLSDNEEEDNKLSNTTGDSLEISLSPSSDPNDEQEEDEEEEEGEEIQPEVLKDDLAHEHTSKELHDQMSEVLRLDTDSKDDDLTQFIIKARDQGCNCLDLSKRNIVEFPSQLLNYPVLQYLYLEGNQLTQLADDFFLRLPNLKWLDLRNNQLTRIPSIGLAKQGALGYLLLGGNLIRTLPVELGKVKTLSALNLDGNPLEHPPFDVVKQGIKAIQIYLRNEHIRQSKFSHKKLDSDDEDFDVDRQIDIVPDVWASDDDDNDGPRRTARSPAPLFSRSQYLPRNTKKSKNVMTKIKTTDNIDPMGDTFTQRAREEQRLIRIKHRNIKIDEELQKTKTKDMLHDWKENYRTNQQQLRRKRLIKGKDYPEAVIQAPFGIDSRYISVMNKDQQEMMEESIKYESRRNRSPETAMREEEERRVRDRQVQNRIREITGKMLKRRSEARGNASEEKRQAEMEIRELRKLESEIKKRRAQIDNRFKAYTGDVKSQKKL